MIGLWSLVGICLGLSAPPPPFQGSLYSLESDRMLDRIGQDWIGQSLTSEFLILTYVFILIVRPLLILKCTNDFFFHFFRLQQKGHCRCDRSAKDANSDSTYSTSNYLCRSFCLFCFYFLVSTQYFFLIDNHRRFLLQKKIAYDLRMTRS